jgi:predicted enzyme related to lactoylglutathione lyase
VWLEIPVTDINRARAFYEKVFGWTCQDEGKDSKEPGVSKIYFFSKGGDFNGAFLVVDSEGLLAPAISPTGNGKDRWSVVTTFAVENVDAALQKVQDAGGKVYRYVLSFASHGTGLMTLTWTGPKSILATIWDFMVVLWTPRATYMEFIPCGDKAQLSIEPTLDTISFIFEQMVCELLLVGDMLRYKPPTPSFFGYYVVGSICT